MLKVTVEDTGGYKEEVDLDIEVLDENEPPIFEDTEFDLNENDLASFMLKASDEGLDLCIMVLISAI